MFKSILAIAEGGPDSAMSFRLAGQLARQFAGAVDAVYLSSAKPEDVHAGTQAMPFLENLNTARFKARASSAKQAFAEFLAPLADSNFDDSAGLGPDDIVARGRRADIIVIGRPGGDPENPEPVAVDPSIHDCARPVMIASPESRVRPLASVVLAWNGSSQAARAVGYALPLLKQADRVSALVVDQTAKAVRMRSLVTYLARHGVSATVTEVHPHAATGRARGRAVIEHVRTSGADLLVMGAYGGGQLASFLGLGGATAKVISSCPVPLLLAH